MPKIEIISSLNIGYIAENLGLSGNTRVSGTIKVHSAIPPTNTGTLSAEAQTQREEALKRNSGQKWLQPIPYRGFTRCANSRVWYSFYSCDPSVCKILINLIGGPRPTFVLCARAKTARVLEYGTQVR